ncbi:MAG: hypothetical protein HC932_04945 [Thermales bacterium]|nr:hypothetical protein [Thermales bacterium]
MSKRVIKITILVLVILALIVTGFIIANNYYKSEDPAKTRYVERGSKKEFSVELDCVNCDIINHENVKNKSYESLKKLNLVNSKFSDLLEAYNMLSDNSDDISEKYGFLIEYREISAEEVQTIKENINPISGSIVNIDNCFQVKFDENIDVYQISTGISLQGGGTDYCFSPDFKLTKEKRLELFGEAEYYQYQPYTGVFEFAYPSNGFTIEKLGNGTITKIWMYNPIDIEEYYDSHIAQIGDRINVSVVQRPFSESLNNDENKIPENEE